jgi:hypothetical protein
MNPASFVDWIESRDLPATALTVAAAVLIAVLAWSYQDRAKPDAANEDEVKAHTRRRRTRIITSGTAGTIAFTVLLIWGPWWIEGHHLRDDKGNLVSSAGIIVTGFRTMLIALAAGGFTAAGLYYTREKHRLEREQFAHTQEQFRLAQTQFRLAQDQFRQAQTQFSYEQQKDREADQRDREARSTEQFVTAVKLLGSSSHAERLGAIYSLKRLSRDSQQHRDPITQLLASFTREREVLIRREKEANAQSFGIAATAPSLAKAEEDARAAKVAIEIYRAEAEAAAGSAGHISPE